MTTKKEVIRKALQDLGYQPTEQALNYLLDKEVEIVEVSGRKWVVIKRGGQMVGAFYKNIS